MNYIKEKEQIDKYFDSITVGVYPFISKKDVTVLKSGFYKKHNAKYCGLTMMYDNLLECKRACLIGYFYVNDNFVILPEKTELTDEIKQILNSYTRKGYKLVSKAPSLKSYDFSEDTSEYHIAEYLYNLHRENDKANNRETSTL